MVVRNQGGYRVPTVKQPTMAEKIAASNAAAGSAATPSDVVTGSRPGWGEGGQPASDRSDTNVGSGGNFPQGNLYRSPYGEPRPDLSFMNKGSGSGASGRGSYGGGGGAGGGAGGSGFIQNYIAESIAPYLQMREAQGKQEESLLASLYEKYGVSRSNLHKNKAIGKEEIDDANKDAEKALKEIAKAGEERSGKVEAAASERQENLSGERSENLSQILKGLEGGDASIGEKLAAMSDSVAADEAANATALAQTRQLGVDSSTRSAGTSKLINQSAISTLGNNYRKARAGLDAAETEAQTGIEMQFAEQRMQLDFQIAQATIQAKREAEAQLQAQRAAAASAASRRRSGGGGGGGGSEGMSKAEAVELARIKYGRTPTTAEAHEIYVVGNSGAFTNSARSGFILPGDPASPTSDDNYFATAQMYAAVGGPEVDGGAPSQEDMMWWLANQSAG